METKYTILLIIVAILLGFLATNPQSLTGKAVTPIHVYGEIKPSLPDGTEITFKVGNIEIGKSMIYDNLYGEDLYFLMDNPKTTDKEGYLPGDKVEVYIEEILIMELSHFSTNDYERDIIIPVSKRAEITQKALTETIGCDPEWQCSNWGECVDGEQNRKCVDIKECRFNGKPAEKRKCELTPIYEEPSYVTNLISPVPPIGAISRPNG